MSWFVKEKPKIQVQTRKKDRFSGWLKCSHCYELIHSHEVEKNYHCCPLCNYHFRISVKDRISLLVDKDSFEERWANLETEDVLNFEDTKPYTKRLKEAREFCGNSEAVVVGTAKIKNESIGLAVLDFNFMAGSMGSTVGEKIVRIIEESLKESLPLLIISASGGARMQESIFSLMQMVKTSAALGKFAAKKLPFISLVTNPTCGGVTASFASLGDVIIAEPNALICFAGPRVIKQTIGERLPEDAQKAKFLLNHGMIDAIVERKDLRNKISDLLEIFLWHKKSNKPCQNISKLETVMC